MLRQEQQHWYQIQQFTATIYIYIYTYIYIHIVNGRELCSAETANVHLSNLPECKYPLISHSPKDQRAQCAVLFSAEGSKVWLTVLQEAASLLCAIPIALPKTTGPSYGSKGKQPTHLAAWLPEPKDACRHPACLSS